MIERPESLLKKVDNSEEPPLIEVYVDASYQRETKRGGIGIYIINRDTKEVLYEKYKYLNNCNKLNSYCSTSAELNAALLALDVCELLGFKSISLIYDCPVTTHALESRIIKKDFIANYRELMSEHFKKIHVRFIHAKYYNHHIHNNAHRLSRRYLMT